METQCDDWKMRANCFAQKVRDLLIPRYFNLTHKGPLDIEKGN